MKAAGLLREAARAGVTVRLAEGKAKVGGQPSPELLARLRERKMAIVAILRGDACRWCSEPLAWPRPVGVVFADGTSECMSCADQELERIWRAAERVTQSPDALTDPAELMLHPGELE